MKFDNNQVIDIVLPVHNEGASIAATLKEFYQHCQTEEIRIRFVICEDGSKDNTVEVLTALKNELPIFLITGPERKGYSRAVVDGFRATTSDWVGFIDSDGQCDPKDFKKFIDKAVEGYEFILGYRHPRADHWIRLLMSGSFKFVYRLLFPITVKDPSCPYLLIHRSHLETILKGEVGILKQGFWWEFLARAQILHPKMCEVPVHHRVRAAGETQVYKPSKIPRIAYEHLQGLFELRRELRQTR